MLYLNHQPTEETRQDWQRPLLAADGYLYLGMPRQALARIGIHRGCFAEPLASPARPRAGPPPYEALDGGQPLSEMATDLYPEENEFTVQRAFALHQLKKGGAAVRVLLDAPEWIRRTGILHYNLACYEAQLGDLSTARQCIKAAIEINASFKKNARTDPDLARLWN